ncbi:MULTISPECIES: hypothetical protein [unclassified Lonepinella]|uniref:hypothetical protein n=1 Tax=unclassified Lonepinella TaxID=2642006 RepID=UPI0036DC62AF
MRKDKKPERRERVALELLTKLQGVSEREMIMSINLTSGRNEVNELERLLDVKFLREWEKTADGTGQYYRYSIPNRETAEILADYVTAKAKERGAVIFNESQLLHILQQFA